jgi:integrase
LKSLLTFICFVPCAIFVPVIRAIEPDWKAATMATIRERTWENKQGKPSKRYQVTFTNAEGKRSRQDFVTRTEAKRFVEGLSEHRREEASKPPPAAPAPPPPPVQAQSGMTFRAAARAYLDACQEGRDGNPPVEKLTLAFYTGGMNNHVLPALGDRVLSDLKRLDIRDFRNAVAKQAISTRMKRLQLFLVKAVIKHALNEEWITADPSVGIDLIRDARREEPTSTLAIHTQEEMERILSTCRSLATTEGQHRASWRRFEVILSLLVFAGLRMSELRGLPQSAVDVEARTIRISQRANLLGDIGPPKSRNGYRTINIPQSLALMLADWLEEHPGELVFSTPSGKVLDHQNLARRMWAPLQVQAGVRVLNPHSTRHFFASWMIHHGMRLHALREVLGHSDPLFTMKVYGHLFVDAEDVALRKEMAEKIGRLRARDDED